MQMNTLSETFSDFKDSFFSEDVLVHNCKYFTLLELFLCIKKFRDSKKFEKIGDLTSEKKTYFKVHIF